MNVWTWIAVAIGMGLVTLFLQGAGRKNQHRYEGWRNGHGKMLEDYDAQMKEIDRYSR